MLEYSGGSCCSQSQQLSTVIARRRQQAAGGKRKTEISRRQQALAQLNAPVNSAHSLKLFYFVSDVVPCSSKTLKFFKVILFHFGRGSMLK